MTSSARVSSPIAVAFAAAVFSSGCALTSDVSIAPLFLMPGDISTAGGIVDLVDQGSYLQALVQAQAIASRRGLNFNEFAALGRAEMACGRFESARIHLTEAFNAGPYRTQAAEIAWDLSQVGYLTNNYAEALQWARSAEKNGLSVKPWHISYLSALERVKVYEFSGQKRARVSMESVNPSVPRIEVRVNGVEKATAVVDSGAVLSIISRELATKLAVESIGDFEGTFYGLLGEPIGVRFGILKRLEIGRVEISDVPVAIMPDEKLSFFIANRKPFKMDLLLGANLLKEMRVLLDFRNGRAEIERLDAADRRPAGNQNLFFVGFRPFVHATINRKGWYLFVLDTGSEITFLNEAEISKTNVRNLPQYHAAMLQGLGGATKRGAKVQDVTIGLDKWAGFFRDLPLYRTEQTRALGIIGENFLKNFTVELDFGSMRMTLDRSDVFALP